jgi:hypothetical protein
MKSAKLDAPLDVGVVFLAMFAASTPVFGRHGAVLLIGSAVLEMKR